MSARQRPPTTGRSNAGSLRSGDGNGNSYAQMEQRSSRSNASSRITVDSARRAVLNDPIEVFRPYTPEGRVMNGHKYNPPVLPSSVSDPILPPYETSRKGYTRPPVCPADWIEKQQRPDILDKSAFINDLEEDVKVKMCRSFVDRNRDRLWRYDSTFQNKTPRTVAHEIIQDPHFVPRMSTCLRKERVFKLSNSDKTAEALNDGSEARVAIDPFASSLTTSRDLRRQKMETMLAPALLQHGRKFQRGYDHAIDFGNFSKYNSVLKTNQATTMNR